MKALILISMIAFSSFASAECPSISPEVERFISKHAADVRGGEYCEFRSVFKSDQVEIALYTIEGACYKNRNSQKGSCGNHYSRYMVGIVNGKPIPSIIVGGKGTFQTHDIQVKGGEIEISGHAYGLKDPMCCPSVGSVKRYKVSEGAFVEDWP